MGMIYGSPLSGPPTLAVSGAVHREMVYPGYGISMYRVEHDLFGWPKALADPRDRTLHSTMAAMDAHIVGPSKDVHEFMETGATLEATR
jgi:hypothetical protein